MNSIIRKLIYLILFGLIIFCFIHLSNKYANNTVEEIKVISDYYSNIDNNAFEVIDGNKMINSIKNGKHLILIGSKNSKWSQKYIEEINNISREINIDKILYYDIDNDKSQKNANYYDIRQLLNGYLTSTDGSENNLLAPSFYIINNGKVMYYNIDTVAMKNTLSVSEYWTLDKENAFLGEIKENILKYYLNN